MGISIQSAVLRSSATTDASTGNSAPSAGGDLFASLLSSQLLGLPVDGTQVTDGKTTAKDPAQDTQATDPSTLLMAGMAVAPTILQNTLPNAKDATSISGDNTLANKGNTPEDLLSQLTGLTADASKLSAQQGLPADPTATDKGSDAGLGSVESFQALLAKGDAQGQVDTSSSNGEKSGENPQSNQPASLTAAAPQNAQAANAAKQAEANLQVRTPLHSAGWSQDLGGQVVWMTRHDQQSAVININPPQLGPVNISLNINGDQASATFVSPHAEVRQAIEDALPRLREMLSGAGINLGQANVGSQLAGQSNNGQPQTFASPRSEPDNAILRETSGQIAVTSTGLLSGGRGAVDLFA